MIPHTNPPHPTKIIYINNQPAEIDIHMVPTIQWLNSLPHTNTHYCCQGETARGLHTKPYVVFTTTHTHTLDKILQTFQNFKNQHNYTHYNKNNITTEIESFQNQTRLTARWHDTHTLIDFNAYIASQGQNTPELT